MGNRPNIRFKGFDDDWEQRKVFDVAEVVGGGTPSTTNPEYWDGDINWYAPAEIGEKIYVDSSERKITKLGLEKSSAKILPAHKTVLFTSRAGIGNTAILRTPAATNQGFQSMVLHDDINPYFVFSMTDMIKGKAERVASGSTFAEISGKMLGNLEFMFPSKDEQDKIGCYFEFFDNLITLHQRKCDETKELKKFMLQKMFPKNGEKVPEIRFSGFTDDWEQRKLGEVFEEYSEKNHEELPALTIIQGGGTVRRDESDRAIQYDKASLSSYKMVRKDDFIMHLRSFEGGLEKATCDGIISPAYHTFHGDEADSRFYYAFFRSYDFIKRKLVPHIYGIRDGKSIDVDGLKSIMVPYPSYDEQKKIGDFLEEMDNLITLHQRKCDDLKQMKKYMLQNMFPSAKGNKIACISDNTTLPIYSDGE